MPPSARILTLMLLVLACLSGCARGRAALQAPADQDALRAGIERILDEALANTPATPAASGGPAPVFAAELLAASSNRGEELLAPRALQGSILMLDNLVRLGAGGVTVKMGYPVLTSGFPRQREYLEFYRSIAREVRKRGLTLLVKTGPVFARTEFSSLDVDLKAIPRDVYLAGRKEEIVTVAREMRPDIITIGSEPMTEKTLTGMDLSPAVYARFVDEVVAAARQPGVRFSVGMGTWDDMAYARALLDTRADDFDIHLYPVYGQNLARVGELCRMARAKGKGVTMSEAWLYKSLGREGGAPEATWAPIFARDAFEDWAGADAGFIELASRLARQYGIGYVSFFWSKYFFGYLPRDAQTMRLSPGQVLRQSNRPAYQGMLRGDTTASGRAFERAARGR